MRPAKFEYFDPHTTGEALKLMETYGEDAKVLAGGLSLVPMMKMRLAQPKFVIDITKIPALSFILESEDAGLSIGALTTYSALIDSRVVQTKFPILAEVGKALGDTQTRNRGTIGGNLCHADPACDYPPVILVLNGEVKVKGPSGERTIKASDFFEDLFTTKLKTGELMTEIRVPPLAPNTGLSYKKFNQRSGDFAIVSTAVAITVEKKNVCKEVRIALGSVAPIPIRAIDAEKALTGKAITDQLIEEASKLAIKGTKPTSDIHGSAAYRTEMIPVITKRALKEAFNRARGEK